MAKAQLDIFMGKAFTHFSKPAKKFIEKCICGIEASGDTKLSSTVHAIDDGIRPASFGAMLVRLPMHPEKELHLVVKGFGQYPTMLLTSLSVDGTFKLQWRRASLALPDARELFREFQIQTSPASPRHLRPTACRGRELRIASQRRRQVWQLHAANGELHLICTAIAAIFLMTTVPYAMPSIMTPAIFAARALGLPFASTYALNDPLKAPVFAA